MTVLHSRRGTRAPMPRFIPKDDLEKEGYGEITGLFEKGQ